MTESSPVSQFDHAKAEAFANRLVGALNEGALALMTSLGHRVGLFDTLAQWPEATSQSLADKAGLAERYVREWLGVMTTLPPEHAAFVTRAAAPNNIAVTSQFIGVAASVEDEMVDRFRDGDGTHYHHYDRFHEVMGEDSAQTVVAALTEHILPIVPGLLDRLRTGIEVTDVGCGCGRAMLHLAQAFPASSFRGIDLCPDAFAETQAEALRKNVGNLTFKAQDLSEAETLGGCDLITAFDAVHDQRDPQGLVRLVFDSLNEGGVFLMQDIGGSRDLATNINNPFAPLLNSFSLMHCTPISLGQGGPGLGAMWGTETAQEFLALAGFEQVEMRNLPHDPINAYFIARR